MSQIDQIRKFIADSIETMDNDKFADPHDVRVKKQVLDGVLREIATIQEQPVCEGLEEEIKRWLKEGEITDTRYDDYGDNDIEATARHFAKWQKEQDDKELSEKIALIKGINELLGIVKED